jgi:hypothetical protein
MNPEYKTLIPTSEFTKPSIKCHIPIVPEYGFGLSQYRDQTNLEREVEKLERDLEDFRNSLENKIPDMFKELLKSSTFEELKQKIEKLISQDSILLQTNLWKHLNMDFTVINLFNRVLNESKGQKNELSYALELINYAIERNN